MIYYDNAATTPLLPEVRDAMIDTIDHYYGNPSSIHRPGREARVIIEEARKQIAHQFNITPAELFFMSSATEAIATVLNSCLRDLTIKNIITSKLEHPAVSRNLDLLQKVHHFNIHYVAHDAYGHINLEDLEQQTMQHPEALVVLMHANNETGTLLPLKKVKNICTHAGALFLCDTVQTIGKFFINLDEGPDFATCSAHKIYGPKGVGFLYKRNNIDIKPLIEGGKQERTMRSGTENIYGITGMKTAIEIACKDNETVNKQISSLRTGLIDGLTSIIPEARIIGSPQHTLSNIINMAFPLDITGDMLQQRLDMNGVAVSGGSACSSGTNEKSDVAKALGVRDNEINIRFSLGRLNTAEELDRFLEIFAKTIAK